MLKIPGRCYSTCTSLANMLKMWHETTFVLLKLLFSFIQLYKTKLNKLDYLFLARELLIFCRPRGRSAAYRVHIQYLVSAGKYCRLYNLLNSNLQMIIQVQREIITMCPTIWQQLKQLKFAVMRVAYARNTPR